MKLETAWFDSVRGYVEISYHGTCLTLAERGRNGYVQNKWWWWINSTVYTSLSVHWPFLLQTKQIHVLPHTFTLSPGGLPVCASTPHLHNLCAFPSRHPVKCTLLLNLLKPPRSAMPHSPHQTHSALWLILKRLYKLISHDPINSQMNKHIAYLNCIAN